MSASRVVRVRLGARSYGVHVGPGLLQRPPGGWRALLGGGSAWIVTDTTVARLYGRALAARLRRVGIPVHLSAVPPGEGAKSAARLEAVALEGLRAGQRRDTTVLALGGGVVGDLGGLLAGTFLRGVRWLQLPTTLLAQVDASVGGKVAVDVGPYKNSLGLFLQPAAVLADVETLSTLPAREFRCGLAESVKMAAVLSRREFRWLERHVERLGPDCSPATLAELVGRMVALKARVVETDERDRGRRALLNFGHTLAHALEGCLGYRWIRHGEAVSIGMAFAARCSVRAGRLAPEEAGRLVGLLRQAGLPVRVEGLDAAPLLNLIKGDKKQSRKGLAFVLTGPLGGGSVSRLAGTAGLARALRGFLREER